MKLFIRIFSITICLLVLLLPIQNVMAQDNGEMDCCKTEQSKDCCSTKDNHNKTSQKSKDCGDCCATAHTCASCFGFLFNKTTELKLVPIQQFQLQNFPYNTPFLQSLADSIWQPPKLV